MVAQRDRVTVQISEDIRSLLEALKYKEENESILVRKSLYLGLTLIEFAEKLKLPIPRVNELIDWLTSYGFLSNQSTNGITRKEDAQNNHQVSGDVPANVYTGFKAACVKKGISESKGLEQALLLWLSQELQKETSEKSYRGMKNGSNKTATTVSNASDRRRPTDGDCVNLAHEVGVREELVLKLRDRLFYDAKR